MRSIAACVLALSFQLSNTQATTMLSQKPTPEIDTILNLVNQNEPNMNFSETEVIVKNS